MDDCPNCEYHRKRAQRWREEAYKQSGYPLPEREWVGLTRTELIRCGVLPFGMSYQLYEAIEAKLKEKNHG